MRSQAPGKICDGLWYLGNPESGVYLLESSDESMVISGGMSYIVPSILRQLTEVGLREDRIRKVLILHAHFDHIGIIPFLSRRHPEITIYASQRATEILANPRSIRTINEFSRNVAARMGMEDVYSQYDLEWSPGLVGETVYDGDIINIGGLEVRILSTPGHSSCSISAYAPQLRALFPSDGGGVPYKDTILTAANSNFTQYLESLKKLELLQVDYLCADHYGYVCGEEARDYITHSLECAEEDYERQKALYLRTRNIDAAAKEVASTFLADNPDYLLTAEIFEGVCRQTMRHIARCVDGLD